MGERKITLFELHFDELPRIVPSFGSDPKPERTDTYDADATRVHEEDDGSGLPVKGAIVGVLAIVALAVAARVLLGGDDEEEEDADVEMVEIDDGLEGVDDPSV